MKPEEIKEELKPSSKALIDAGPARPPEANLDFRPLPNIMKLIECERVDSRA